MKYLVLQALSVNKTEVLSCANSIQLSLKNVIDHRTSINHLEEKVSLLSPAETLKRGYSITRKDGKAITAAAKLAPGNMIEIEFAEGKITTTV
jgi:exodeoxyribonuclease VII large subunit